MKYIGYGCITSLFITVALCASEPAPQKTIAIPQIALIIAFYGYHSIEYGATKQVLEAEGFKVTTVSTNVGIAQASDGSTTTVDCPLKNLDCMKYDGIVLIGGAGCPRELDKQEIHLIVQKARQAKKVIGAICYAPRILAHAGILAGKKVTGWNDDMQLEPLLKQSGATYSHKHVVIDGSIITADDPESAADFGKAIIIVLRTVLKGDQSMLI